MENNILLITGIITVIIVSIGLAADIIFAVLYISRPEKRPAKVLSAVPWTLTDILTICFVLASVYFTCSLLSYILVKRLPHTKPAVTAVCGILIYILNISVIAVFAARREKKGISYIGIDLGRFAKKFPASAALYAGFIPVLIILAYAGIILCSILGISPHPHPIIGILKREKSPWIIYYLIFTAAAAAPVFEEMLFRGLFYQTLKKKFGIIRAAVFSSSIFSLLHFNTAQFLPIMGLGIFLCLLFEYTGSLLSSITVHMLNNGIFLGIFFLLKDYF